MSNSKKLTVKRLVIFLILAFFPFYIIIPVMYSYYGEPIFVSENETVIVANYVVGVFGMIIPSIAHIITRLVTKEGFKNTYLGLNTKGKMGYFIASAAVPLAYSFISMVLIWLIFSGETGLSGLFSAADNTTAGLLLLQFSYSVICFFPAFGEEWGWRGYMMPKLLELMPKPAAVIVGGVIWGLWHAPLTVVGHNFGVDYPGYPFVGIGLMCLMCTLMNAFLTLITEKTKSVYPAAFCHALNNNLSFGVMFAIFGSEAAIDKISEVDAITGFLSYIWILAVVGTVSFILLMKKDKRDKQVLEKAA